MSRLVEKKNKKFKGENENDFKRQNWEKNYYGWIPNRN